MSRVKSDIFFALAVMFFLFALVQTGRLLIANRPNHPNIDVLFETVGAFLPSVVCYFVSRYLRPALLPEPSIKDGPNYRLIVTLTENAAELFRRSCTERKYADDTAMRIVRDENQGGYDVRYDMVSDDDADWIGESLRIAVIIDKQLAVETEGMQIDAKDGRFVFNAPKTLTAS